MLEYTYKDNNNEGKVVFVCQTTGGISQADKLFQETIGKHPISMPYIGCSFVAIAKSGF